MEIRKLCPEEWGAAAALVWQVFQRFEAPEYPPQGMEAFRSFLEDRQGLLSLGAWAAWEGEELIGVLASRREGSHICLCFVREDFHRRGIGRSLWEHFLAETCAKRITLPFTPRRMPWAFTTGWAFWIRRKNSSRTTSVSPRWNTHVRAF